MHVPESLSSGVSMTAFIPLCFVLSLAVYGGSITIAAHPGGYVCHWGKR